MSSPCEAHAKSMESLREASVKLICSVKSRKKAIWSAPDMHAQITFLCEFIEENAHATAHAFAYAMLQSTNLRKFTRVEPL